MDKEKGNILSRRGIVIGGAIAGIGSALGLSALTASPSEAATAKENDAAILNAAIDLEHQAIWAYTVAAGKLTSTEVGATILALAKRNLADHIKHRDALASVIKSLGKKPSAAKKSYDLSSYIKAGEGNLDSDANIAKLALALEYDAALAYIGALSKLKTPAIITAAGTIAPDETAHATAIRAVFKTLIPEIEYVPASFVSPQTRSEWILKV